LHLPRRAARPHTSYAIKAKQLRIEAPWVRHRNILR
jgi:hypothetical protein